METGNQELYLDLWSAMLKQINDSIIALENVCVEAEKESERVLERIETEELIAQL